MMKNVISIDRISKTYGKGRKKNTVYQDFSLFVPKSSHLICLTGPDGAGKSTLLKLLCGLQKPDCGTIRLGEYEPDNIFKVFISGEHSTRCKFSGDFMPSGAFTSLLCLCFGFYPISLY